MEAAGQRKIVAVLDDLFFLVKIMDAAKRCGAPLAVAKDEATAERLAAELPALLLIDLNVKAVDAVELIRRLRSSPRTVGVPIAGYVSHVQTDLKARALAAGADTVVARSAFSQSLGAILDRYAGPAAPGD
jgi:CheY-like chemotaxis protein